MAAHKHPDLRNTEVAFSRFSDSDLLKTRRLFNLFNYPNFVRWAPAFTTFALRIGFPIKGIVKRTIFNHFCGGETIADCDRTVQKLHAYGIGAILDYSAEGHQKESDFDRNYEEIRRTIQKAATDEAYPFAVFKPTGVGRFNLYAKRNERKELSASEEEEFLRVHKRIEGLCALAAELDVPLFIDAEESWIQDCLDEIVGEMMMRFNREKVIVFNTVQLYRKGRLEYMKNLYESGRREGYKIGLKLVRGAYMEKERERALELGYPSPIQDNKADSDRDYNRAVEMCFENRDITKVCVGTHNEESSILLVKLMEEAGMDPGDDRFWFAQLYGMSDHISFNLAEAGYKVAKYLPYGPVVSVLPYLSRRATENSSVAGQAGREISLINQEISRRRLAG